MLSLNTHAPFPLDQGYCEHGSNLFPAWHRPYVALLESSITGLAKEIASTYPKALRKDYKLAAEALRWPYWDWARSKVIPDFLYKPLLEVTGPNGLPMLITNPFASYTFQRDTSPDVLQPNPPAAYSQWPYTVKENFTTVRWPMPTNNTQYGPYATNVSALRATLYVNKPYGVSFAQAVLDLMTIDNWECFATTASSTNPNCTFMSIEGIHNLIHLYSGGHLPKPNNTVPGFMSVLETAGFDPIFFLHHANVDRLIALWQVCDY